MPPTTPSHHALFHTALVWFRRDLRSFDHTALHHALSRSETVFCAFIYDNNILGSLPRADRRVEFIHACIEALAAELQQLGSGLIVRHAVAQEEIPRLALELNADAVFANHDYEPQAMAQLNRTGYLHNRLRMVTASFLVKDLGIDWRRGEAYFALRLNDFDLAANNGGWQWTSSSGCDAQPYFRIFNPVTQSEKFDPEGKFIKRYLPQPIVMHDEARKRTLARYAVVKKP